MNSLSDKDRIQELLEIILAAKTDSIDVLDNLLKCVIIIECENERYE